MASKSKKGADAASAAGGFHPLDMTKSKLWPETDKSDEKPSGQPNWKSVKAIQKGKTYSADEVENIVAAAVAAALQKEAQQKEEELVIGGK